MRIKRFGRALAIAMSLVMVVAGVAIAATDIDNTDRAIVGTASTSGTAAQLECGGAAVSIQLTVTADNGNIPSNPSYPASGTVTAPTALSVNSAGALVASGSQSQTFVADQNFNTTSQTLTFSINLSAAANAPAGASSGAITFSDAGTGMVNLGSQIDLNVAFTNPSVFWNVTCASYEIVGFYQPVNMTAINGVKGGQTVPLKFDILLDDVEQSDTSLVTSLIQKFSCTSVTESLDMLTTDELSSGSTSLRWDSGSEQFVFNWKTPKSTGCYRVTLTVEGGDSISADFLLK